MIRLSIIIPCLETNSRLDDTLASVLQNRPQACEVIVVHRDPYDDPYDLADEVVFREAPAGASLIGLLNEGLEVARAPYIHLLQCGCEVEDGWTDRVLERFEDARVGAVSPLVFDRTSAASPDCETTACVGVEAGKIPGRRVRLHSGERPDRQRPLGPALAASFYRAESLREIGGFASCVGAELADLDVALALNARKLRCVVESSSRVSNSAKPHLSDGAFREGQAAERLFWRHVFGPIGGGLGAILLHPLVLAWDALLDLPRGGAVGRLAGRVSVLAEARRHARFGPSLKTSAKVKGAAKGKSRRLDQPHAERRAVGRNSESLTP